MEQRPHGGTTCGRVSVAVHAQAKVIVFRDIGTMSTSELVQRINKSTSRRSND
jgi:hypothetical protein